MEPPNKVIKLRDISGPSHLPTSDEIITENDLPLLANIGDVRVHHYIMKLCTNFSRKVISGSVILFLEWLKPSQNKIILDQCFLNIKQVTLLKTEKEYNVVNQLLDFDNSSGSRKNFYQSSRGEKNDWFQDNGESFQHLTFAVNKWSVTIEGWKDCSPAVLKIDYETLDTSPSIHWRPCDGFNYREASSKCCYTPAPAMNNRGLFPCQEPPSAMATWEVMLDCEKKYTPLLTSDEPGKIIGDGEGNRSIHYFYCSTPLPMSTFAMIVGKAYFLSDLVEPECSESVNDSNTPRVQAATSKSPKNMCQNHEIYPCRYGVGPQEQTKVIPVRMICFDPDTVPRDCSKFAKLVSTSLISSAEHFGPHPFSRLDIVIVPKSYPHEGLSSPSMIFLSPNNFYGEEPLYVSKVPHEICHSWFGLLIGSLDWTEEWLSEGFATYCEDVLFQAAFEVSFPNKSAQDIQRDHALKILMRFTSLQTELCNTNGNDELHVISKGSSDKNSQSAMNGLVPIKQFMRVHYYKGYLPLWRLTSLVGQDQFLKFLKDYVLQYHGQLVTSEIFLECYHSHFNEILCYQDCDAIMMNLKKEWLQSNKLPEPYNSMNILDDEFAEDKSLPPLFSNALEPLKNTKRIFQNLLQEDTEINFKLENLSSSELLLLLELILNGLPKLSHQKWKIVERKYFQYFVTSQVFQNVEQRHNADVAHRWCELIIFFKDKSRLPVVENFLRNNISMGVYLYGELMITEKFAFQKVAKKLYYELNDVFDLATKKILKEMIF